MSQVWALVSKSGSVEIRFTDSHPAECGHEEDCVGKAIYQLDREPEAGETVEYKTGQIVPDQKVMLAVIRKERDLKLERSDKLMLPDRGFSEDLKVKILRYREDLRNITNGDILDSLNIVWPINPTE